MIVIRRALERVRRSDDGLSLVEVVIALLIFTVIVLGAIASTAVVLKMTSDNRGRVEAANLAQQYIDVARVDGQKDLSGLANKTYPTVTVDGIGYTVTRTVSWITTNGTDTGCTVNGVSGNGSLLFRRVNIRVSWANQTAASQDIAADTVLAPTSKINDPSLGTVLISVTSINGGGTPNVTAKLAPDASVPGNTAQVLDASTQPALTNADGCTVANKVAPGTYTVTLSPPSGQYRDQAQAANPVKSVTVAAGDSGGAAFTYDPAWDFQNQYSSGVAASLPNNLSTSYVSTLGVLQTASTVSDQYLSPIASGYAVYAGKYAPAGTAGGSCLSTDPTSWPKSADNRTGKAPVQSAPPTGASIATPTVAMGAVTINVSAATTTIRATTTSAANGDPGCSAGQTYTFTRAATAKDGTMTIALPWGTWAVSQSSNAINFNPVSLGTIVGSLLGVLVPGTGNVVTLDPRTLG